MKKIGFIDYYLDEWHANHYPLWIRSSTRSQDFDVAYAFAAIDKPDGMDTKTWCEKYGVQAMESIESLVEASDCLVILSPDHPEQHEALAQVPLRSGKPTYIDKTFAPDFATAKRLFDLAHANKTPMYSTSALRYARELVSWIEEHGLNQPDVSFMSVRGPGVFENYGVHQLEMIVRGMGVGATKALATGSRDAPVIIYTYQDHRCCLINHLPWSDFSLAIQDAHQNGMACDVKEDFWMPFMEELLGFFDSGLPPVPQSETLSVMAMLDAGKRALSHPCQWVEVPFN
ncbi:MAG: Gfo/Idh/MocA family oxidoreductase [Clostridia bacterium]|nr:Gfo/Idh/MocA family oxidoreductase [Clostridia bacterium]